MALTERQVRGALFGERQGGTPEQARNAGRESTCVPVPQTDTGRQVEETKVDERIPG